MDGSLAMYQALLSRALRGQPDYHPENQVQIGPKTQDFINKYELRQPGEAGPMRGGAEYYRDLAGSMPEEAFQYQYGLRKGLAK